MRLDRLTGLLCTICAILILMQPLLSRHAPVDDELGKSGSAGSVSLESTPARQQAGAGPSVSHAQREGQQPPWSASLQNPAAPGARVTLSRGRFTATVDREKERVFKVRLQEGSDTVSWRRAAVALQREADFRSLVRDAIGGSSWEAEFWETPPVSSASLDRPFEFVLVDAPALRGLRPDPEPFVEKMAEAASESSVISFENLGRDALLVVPQCAAGHKTGHRSTRAPTCEGWQPAEGAPYAHIADFMRGAPSEQVHELLALVGKEVERRVASNSHGGTPVPLWVSTSGLGVSWLHVRLDSRPKYYTYAPYKQPGQ